MNMLELINLRTLQATACQALPLLLDVIIKGAALLCIATAAALAMRKASAAARQTLWLVTLAGLLVLPLASLALPGWQVLPEWADISLPAEASEPLAPKPPAADPVEPAALETAVVVETPSDSSFMRRPEFVPSALDAGPIETLAPQAETPSEASSDEAPADALAVGASAKQPDVQTSEETSAWPWLAVGAVGLYLLGVVVCLCPLIFGRLSLQRFARKARPITGEAWQGLLGRAASAIGLRRRVTLLRSHTNPMPMVWGIWRPKVLLPANCDTWKADRRWVVLLHELAHAKRDDCLAKFVAHLACSLYWFNPLCWLAFKQMQREAEQACDDLVLSAGHRPSDYAQHLLDIASGLKSGMLAAYSSIAMARRSKLEGRLLAILDPNRRRKALTRLGLLIAITVTATIAIPLACMTAAENQVTPSDESTSASTTATLSLQLTDSDGKPLENQSLQLVPATVGNLDAPDIPLAFADKSGKVTIESIAPGKHRFVVNAEWPQPTFLTFDVPADGLDTKAIVLPAPPKGDRPDLDVKIETVRAADADSVPKLAVTISNNTDKPYTLTDSDLRLTSQDRFAFPSASQQHVGKVVPARGKGDLRLELDLEAYVNEGLWCRAQHASWNAPAEKQESTVYYRVGVANCYSLGEFLSLPAATPQPEQAAWGEAVDGLEVSISIDGKVFDAEKPIPLRWAIRNTSKEDKAILWHELHYSPVVFDITDATGKAYPNRIDFRRRFIVRLPAPPEKLILRPGEVKEASFDLSRFIGMLRGELEIVGVYAPKASELIPGEYLNDPKFTDAAMGRIASKPLKLTVYSNSIPGRFEMDKDLPTPAEVWHEADPPDRKDPWQLAAAKTLRFENRDGRLTGELLVSVLSWPKETYVAKILLRDREGKVIADGHAKVRSSGEIFEAILGTVVRQPVLEQKHVQFDFGPMDKLGEVSYWHLSLSRQAPSKLSFRVAPMASELSEAEADSYRDSLKAGKVGPWWEKEQEWSGPLPTYMWLPVRDEVQTPQLITGEYEGKTYVLVSAKPGETMVPGEGEDAWGLNRVALGPDAVGKPAINIMFDDAGAKRFGALTKANLNRHLAIIVDDEVFSAPRIMSEISGTVQITGDFSKDEAEAIIEALRAGMIAATPATQPAADEAARASSRPVRPPRRSCWPACRRTGSWWYGRPLLGTAVSAMEESDYETLEFRRKSAEAVFPPGPARIVLWVAPADYAGGTMKPPGRLPPQPTSIFV